MHYNFDQPPSPGPWTAQGMGAGSARRMTDYEKDCHKEEATGPGVLRDWFSLIHREVFNPANALFIGYPNDRRRFFLNPASGVNPVFFPI